MPQKLTKIEGWNLNAVFPKRNFFQVFDLEGLFSLETCVITLNVKVFHNCVNVFLLFCSQEQVHKFHLWPQKAPNDNSASPS